VRVTELMLGSLLTTDIQNTQAQLLQAQEELATGNRINEPSDDPAGTERVLTLRATLDANAQYQKNASDALTWMQTTQSALGSAIQLATQARNLALQAQSGLNASQVQDLASQMQAVLAQLVDIGNTRLGDRYVFNGQETATAPFSLSGGVVSTHYGPVPNQPLVREIGPGVTVTINPGTDQPASNVFQWSSGTGTGGLLPAVAQLAADLQAGNLAAVGGADLTALDAATSAVEAAQGEVGAAMQRVQAAQAQLTAQATALQGLEGSIQGADVAQVIVQYQELQNAFQSALSVGAHLILPTLADYLPA
jgi:flagellar hook-associated protein 3 FlgL